MASMDFRIEVRSPGGERIAAAFKSLQAAILLKMACDGAGLVQVEFSKAIGETVRAFANLLELATEDNFLAYAEKIERLMPYEDSITRAVIEAEERIAEKEEALSRAENGAEL